MYLLDSCVVIAYFRKEEMDHKEAMTIIDQIDRFVITDYILVEVVNILMMKEGIKVAQMVLKYLTSNKSIEIFRLDDDELDTVITDYQKLNKKISFADLSLKIIAQKRKLELVTFDKQLKKIIK